MVHQKNTSSAILDLHIIRYLHIKNISQCIYDNLFIIILNLA